MFNDPYAVLRALLRAEAVRHTPESKPEAVRPSGPENGRGTTPPAGPASPASPASPVTPASPVSPASPRRRERG